MNSKVDIQKKIYSQNKVLGFLGLETDWHNHNAKTDIIVGLSSTHVWLTLGWHDIKQRYRRSVLGPFWFTLSTLIMVGVLGILYSTLLGQDITTYLPYLGVGLVLWQYISSCVNEGASTFISSSHIIQQIRMPITIHVCRVAWRNFVILLHSLPVVVILMLIFGHSLTFEFFLLLPALAIILLHGIWSSIVIGLLCTRYRDLLPIVGNIMQIAFFFTPIMWTKDLLKDRAWAADINPFHHLIEIVRAPILGSPIEVESWVWSIALLFFGFALAQYLTQRCRNRVPYWI